MSISHDSATTIVCREVFDETSHPSNEEVIEYAKRLGIDPDAEAHLLDLAREGLMAALPEGWSPCFHEASGAWYYYQASTGTTTWEHPLDAVYKELVAQAKAGNRQMSVDEDSKATAKDLESHEEATLPKENLSSNSLTSQSQIPKKLEPLKKVRNDKTGSKKRESSLNMIQNQQDQEAHAQEDNPLDRTLTLERSMKDYTNLRFQDPKFYESPQFLDSSNKRLDSSSKQLDTFSKQLDSKKVFRRSESLSPRHEKNWEQLSKKFNSDENIIDIDINIDRLSTGSPVKPDKSAGGFSKGMYPRHPDQQKELTLTGGGSIFLKSNRDRITTPSQENGKLEDFQISSEQAISSSSGDKLKSILREKPSEDEERPMEEERKSVRFDLDKKPEIKYTYFSSDEDWDSEPDEQNARIKLTASIKKAATLFSVQSPIINLPNDSQNNRSTEILLPSRRPTKLEPLEQVNRLFSTPSKIIGKRFVVRNVSEVEHFDQISRDKVDFDEDYSPRRFSNVKNIDLLSRSETDSSIASRSSFLEEIRKSKELMLESMKFSDQRMRSIKLDLNPARGDQESSRSSSDAEECKNYRFNLKKEHDKTIKKLKDELELKLKISKEELEEEFQKQKLVLEKELEGKLGDLRREMADKETQEIRKLVEEMDKMRAENIEKMKSDLEVCYEKERQEYLANVKIELEQKKQEVLKFRNQELEKIENDCMKNVDVSKDGEFREKGENHEGTDMLKSEFDKELDDVRAELRLQQEEKIAKITEEHEKCLAEILRDFRTDEELARNLYKQRLEEIRLESSRDLENEMKKQCDKKSPVQESIDFEKIRCEKRLIEDKYNTLKEKYMKLKREVRIAVERRTKRKEAIAAASETEKSTSGMTRTEKTESFDQKSAVMKTHSKPSIPKSREAQTQGQSVAEDSGEQKQDMEFPGPARISEAKNAQRFESDDTTTCSETNLNSLPKKKKNFPKRTASTSRLNNNSGNENPVENIRKQLEKLEDLGDQLPSNEIAYTLRYPFQDKSPVNATSELDFFKHRIHVERDSVRRAREALKQQRSAFQSRQKAWKQRSARATLEQLVKEERELSEMEVSLHRTRSLLGEKVIHLRHLEQSLERIANAKRNENDASVVKSDEQTLSDMSSASSGFSSTDLGTDTFIDRPDYYQESTEIIASLENLNSEIREIWSVLNERHDNNVPPPPTLLYSDLRWLPYQHSTSQASNLQAFGTPNIQSNILSQLTTAHSPATNAQNIISQYGPNSGFSTTVGTVTMERAPSNLMERTRNLRDWLRQARIESSDLISPGQATL